MVEAVSSIYEVLCAPGAHWDIPYARLEDATPTPSNPAAVLAVAANIDQLTGTILSINANQAQACIDFAAGSIYWQQVRNVLTYAVGVEATWGAIDIGDLVYYDRSATMVVGDYLSTSPLDNAVAANPLFGRVIAENDADAALYPKGGAAASTQWCGVIQRGAGA